jgi:hypothetical protein
LNLTNSSNLQTLIFKIPFIINIGNLHSQTLQCALNSWDKNVNHIGTWHLAYDTSLSPVHLSLITLKKYLLSIQDWILTIIVTWWLTLGLVFKGETCCMCVWLFFT